MASSTKNNNYIYKLKFTPQDKAKYSPLNHPRSALTDQPAPCQTLTALPRVFLSQFSRDFVSCCVVQQRGSVRQSRILSAEVSDNSGFQRHPDKTLTGPSYGTDSGFVCVRVSVCLYVCERVRFCILARSGGRRVSGCRMH